ncbi:hypothetical protein FDECE_11179 [Fusarium decemcellulare]|nr:hypothetical protein FDECE_11179 [Fusarium decemcellulare]
MLEELWLDLCWAISKQEGEEEEDEGGRADNFTAWLEEQDSDVGGDTGHRENERESEEEDEDASDLSDDGDTASDTSYIGDGPDDLDLESYRKEYAHQDDETHNSVDPFLILCYRMAIEDLDDGKSSSTMLVYFSAVRGMSTHKGNKLMRPSQYIHAPIPPRLIYCTQLVFLEAILPRRAHLYAGFPARPRYGQLAALNTVRAERM